MSAKECNAAELRQLLTSDFLSCSLDNCVGGKKPSCFSSNYVDENCILPCLGTPGPMCRPEGSSFHDDPSSFDAYLVPAFHRLPAMFPASLGWCAEDITNCFGHVSIGLHPIFRRSPQERWKVWSAFLTRVSLTVGVSAVADYLTLSSCSNRRHWVCPIARNGAQSRKWKTHPAHHLLHRNWATCWFSSWTMDPLEQAKKCFEGGPFKVLFLPWILLSSLKICFFYFIM